jgi:hypothetical protein
LVCGSAELVAACGAAFATAAWDALVDKVANSDGGGDQPEQRVRVAGHMATGEPLHLAVAVGDGVIFGGLAFASADRTRSEQHGLFPLKKARRFPSRGKPARQSDQSVL